jgi:beta-galactosidase
MEAMAGPADAGNHNTHPAPGMVRLWTWEAFAHGAEVVSYFRWRQVHYAAEQWWHGLHRPDGLLSRGGREARQVADELQSLGDLPPPSPARVALVVDYEAQWTIEVQPHSAWFSYQRLAMVFYTALRRLGLDVDIVRAGSDLSAYDLVVVPTLPHVSDEALSAFEACSGEVIFGPRTGSKTQDYQIPLTMPPGPLKDRLGLKVVAVESLRPDLSDPFVWNGRSYSARLWRDHVEAEAEPAARFADQEGAVWRSGTWHYLAFHPDESFLMDYCAGLVEERGIPVTRLPATLRLRRRGSCCFAFNYADTEADAPAPENATFVLGQRRMPPHGVAAWRD